MGVLCFLQLKNVLRKWVCLSFIYIFVWFVVVYMLSVARNNQGQRQRRVWKSDFTYGKKGICNKSHK